MNNDTLGPPQYKCGHCQYEGVAQTSGIAVWCPKCQMNDKLTKTTAKAKGQTP